MSGQGRIGVDESGKGDYFGPLVIAACYVAPFHEVLLEGVTDSKKLSDKRALELAQVIEATCPNSVIVVKPARYNELHAKMRNLNRLLEWGHAKAVENVLALEGVDCNLIVSDQFANPAGLRRIMGLKNISIELESRVRAEADLAVAAASVLARAAFLRNLEQLGDSIGVPLPKGAGPVVDATAKNLVRARGPEVLVDIAKLHFKTTLKVLGRPMP